MLIQWIVVLMIGLTMWMAQGWSEWGSRTKEVEGPRRAEISMVSSVEPTGQSKEKGGKEERTEASKKKVDQTIAWLIISFLLLVLWGILVWIL
jgi:hypothetical protein